MLTSTVLIYVFIAVLILFGSITQGTIGFGLGTIATPFIAMLKPELVPTLILILALFIASYTLSKNYRETSWRIVAISCLARIPGSLVGAWALTLLSHDGLSIMIGVAVLLAMSLSGLGWSPQPSTQNTVVAGVASGFLGTTTSIGGPPMALVLKRFNPAQVRGTLSATFVLGCIISLSILTWNHQATLHQVSVAAAYLPLVALGLYIANRLNKRIDAVMLNRIVIVVAVSAALVLIVQSGAALMMAR
ncbi:sulfite exporter TauE/SafE family protein [Corynebacterium epidermidicanis]|uniref:sulfite exporter TauE/SafE family protein n=1 Tax=Corynebacterium epidermidicanis TaxID=1050174 RepID=UPI00064177B9|nr:sulfite exporter TauE/SafE family protein [Corynebacterium epidermidicanis]